MRSSSLTMASPGVPPGKGAGDLLTALRALPDPCRPSRNSLAWRSSNWTVPGLMPLPFLRRMHLMPKKYPTDQRDRALRMARAGWT